MALRVKKIKNQFHEEKLKYLLEKTKLFAPWCATSSKFSYLLKRCQGNFWDQYSCMKRKISLSKIAPGYDVVDTKVKVRTESPYEILGIKNVKGLETILEKAFAVAAVFESGVQFLTGLVCKDRNQLEKLISSSLKGSYKPSYGSLIKLRLVIDPNGKKKIIREDSSKTKIKAFSERILWVQQTFEFDKTASLPLERVKELYMAKFGLRPKKEFKKYLWDIFLEFELYYQTGVIVILSQKKEDTTPIFVLCGIKEKNGGRKIPEIY
jgi:hypothetical protein